MFVLQETADAVVRWLSIDSDVLVVGDRGAGRTSLATHLAEFSPVETALTVRGSRETQGIPLGALQTHPTLAATSSRRSAFAEATSALIAALDGTALLLVDDAHLLDPVTLAAIDSAVTHTGARVIVLVPTGSTSPAPLAHLLAGAPLVRIAPLGLRATSRMLTAVLGAPVSADLAAGLSARSGGNPRVITALTTAARWAGVIVDQDGLWTQVAPWTQVPHGGVVTALTADLGRSELRALDLLSWVGPLDLDRARLVIDPADLHELESSGRIVTDASGRANPTLSIYPPALARAIRLDLSPLRVAELNEVARTLFGQDVTTPLAATDDSRGTDWRQGAAGDSAHLINESVNVYRQRLALEHLLRRERWRATPDVARAVAYLQVAPFLETPQTEVEEVFARTRPTATDTPADLENLTLMWRDIHLDEAPNPVPDWLVGQDNPHAPDGRGRDRVPGSRSPFAGRERCDKVIHHLWRGDAPAALMALGDHDEIEVDPILVRHHLDAARADALLLAGHGRDAIRWTRQRLADAFEATDPLGVRLAARSLATALVTEGEPGAAWQVVSATLRLGTGGSSWFGHDSRALALAAALRARAGDVRLAESLRLQLQANRPDNPDHLLDAWVGAELDYARGRSTEASQALWQEGKRELDRGHATGAMVLWIARREVATAAQLTDLDAVWSTMHAPGLAPWVDLHRALALGDTDAALATMEAHALHGPLGWAAQAVVRLRQESGADALPPERLLSLVGPEDAETTGPHTPALGEPLTDREREIVLLVRAGISNRQVAARLFLSLRTVENHLYRAMRKLGATNRTDLSAWDPTIT